MLISTLHTIKISVLALVVGQVFVTFVNTIITMFYSEKEVDYSLKEQINDIKLIILFSVIMASIVYVLGLVIVVKSVFFLLILQISIGLIIFLSLTYIYKIKALKEIIIISRELINKTKK